MSSSKSQVDAPDDGFRTQDHRGTLVNYPATRAARTRNSTRRTASKQEKHGLDVRAVENCSYHYHRTVEQWLENFETPWERIRALDPVRFNEKFRQAWLFYLSGAAETFEAAREVIRCFHITFVKGQFARTGWARSIAH